MASLNINVSDLPEAQGYDLIPDGWYTATIKGAELKTTKDGSGRYIAVQYRIDGPEYAGRVVFGNLNIKNANAAAEEIGKRQLGELMTGIGLTKIEDTDQLIGGTLSIKVGTSKKQEGFEVRNEVKGFKAIEGAPPMAVAGSKAPWQK